MKPTFLYLLVFLLLIVLASVWWISDNDRTSDVRVVPTPAATSTPTAATLDPEISPVPIAILSEDGVEIKLTELVSGMKVTSPARVEGEVPGNWSFEANFTIDIVNAKGEVIGNDFANLEGDWMTEAYVPFTSNITFAAQDSGTAGVLRLHRANPSGLPENEDIATLPIAF